MNVDVLIIGGGPAGCAAALTAASVDMRVLLIEQKDHLCAKLRQIAALNNVLGGYRTGPDLATAITADLTSNPRCTVLTGTSVVALTPEDDRVTLTLDTGDQHSAPYAVVATGVGPQQPSDTDWITAPNTPRLPPLWETDPDQASRRVLLVLGADRPLGTFLRAHPQLDTTLLVVHPAADAYKAEEVAHDPRLTLIPAAAVTLFPEPQGVAVKVRRAEGNHTTHHADAAFANIGSTPSAPAGVVRAPAGYCPPHLQHPRVLTAGDLRSARFQRIMTATGSGAEAALHAYYASRGLSHQI